MIQVEPIQNLDGFGTGQTQSEYFYSQGMCRTQFGLTPNWLCTDEITSALLSGLNLINWFSANAGSIFGIDTGGVVYGTPFVGSWTSQYTPNGPKSGNGMIVDQTNRVLVAGDRYLSKWDGVTPNYTTGSVTLNGGNANVTGSGTTFTAGMVGKQIMFAQQLGVLYTIATFTDATHIVLNTTFTGASTASAFTVYMGSTEQWKDFGSAFVTTGLRQMDIYEDWVVIANANAVAILNVTDDSFNNEGLDLPTGYTVATLRAGRSGVLIGVNANSRGAVFLWDAVAVGSISEWIWFPGNIKAIIPIPDGKYGYCVITSRGIFLTDGYTVQALYQLMPDDRTTFSRTLQNLQPQSVALVGNLLIFLGGTGDFTRARQGIYIFNMQTRLFEFCPVSNGVQFNVSLGAVFYDNSQNLHLSYKSLKPSVTAIAKLLNGAPNSAFYITEPKGVMVAQGTGPGNEKNAEAAKFTITESPRQTPSGQNNTFTVSLKIYNFKRVLWLNAQTRATASAANQVLVDGSLYPGIGRIGDEVTPLEGVNAGKAAHITSISNQGTNTEIWTLDTTLAGGNTESGVELVISPFRLVKTFTFSSLGELRDVYFDIKNKYSGKRFLLKLLLTNINTELDITDGQFIYNDQGITTP